MPYNTGEACKMDKEALGLHLYGVETDKGIEGETLIPLLSEVKNLELEKGQSIILVDVYMLLFRYTLDNKAVKKIVTIPNWMDTLEKIK